MQSYKIVQALLFAGADPLTRTLDGKKPLNAVSNNLLIVKLL
jgi:hypothetical protein